MFLTNIIRLVKSRRVSCVGHLTLIWGKKRVVESLVGKLRGRGKLENLSVDGKVISK